MSKATKPKGLKEFEKWYERQVFAFLTKEAAEFAWKAALKWVLSRVQYANSDGSIIYDIKKELKDES